MPSSRMRSTCSSVSSPSTVTSMPRERASAAMVRTIASARRVSASSRNDRSIFSELNGNSRRELSDE